MDKLKIKRHLLLMDTSLVVVHDVHAQQFMVVFTHTQVLVGTFSRGFQSGLSSSWSGTSSSTVDERERRG